MRVSTKTLIVVLVCLFGGALSSSVVFYQYKQVEEYRAQRENSLLALREIDHMQTILSQWFVTIDLFFTDQQGYLNNSIQNQVPELAEMLRRIRLEMGKINNIEKQQHFANVHADLNTVKELTNQAAIMDAQQGKEWNQLINKTDNASNDIIENIFYISEAASDNAKQKADAFEQQQQYFIQIAEIAGIVYLAFVFLAWFWANINIVRPLVKLTQTAQDNKESGTEKVFLLTSGPKEIRHLSKSLQDFSTNLNKAKNRIQKEKKRSEQDKERIATIMNTAASSIITTDANGIIETANDTTLALFNQQIEDIIGQPIEQFIPDIIQEETVSKTLSNSRGKLLELTGKQTDGEDTPIEVATGLMNIGNQQNFTLVINDISERKENEHKVQQLNQRLQKMSREAGVAEVATSILHNIGNALNSVNTATSVIGNKLRKTRLPGLEKVLGLMSDVDGPILGDDPEKTKQLTNYLSMLNQQLREEQKDIREELGRLIKHIKHIETIVSSQQSHATQSSIIEDIVLEDVIEESLGMNNANIINAGINITKDYQSIDKLKGEQHKVMQILVNLIRNAVESIMEQKPAIPTLSLTLQQDKDKLSISIKDNGVGINEEGLKKIFTFGFTTKEQGHGFGLHGSILEAKNMGGMLNVDSTGKGQGATFTLVLPIEQPDKRSSPTIEEDNEPDDDIEQNIAV